MEANKVYLFVETPFSVKKPKGFLVLPMVFSLVIYVIMIALFWLKMPDMAQLVTVPFGCAFLLSALWIAVFRLSWVAVEEGNLVCRYCGIFPRRICITPWLRGWVVGNQLQVVDGNAVRLRLPDSEAARQLLTFARIPMAW